jgi:hypothetical protein
MQRVRPKVYLRTQHRSISTPCTAGKFCKLSGTDYDNTVILFSWDTVSDVTLPFLLICSPVMREVPDFLSLNESSFSSRVRPDRRQLY